MQTSGLMLFVCAGLLLSGGAILCGTTAWGLLRMSYYFWTTELGVELGATVLLMAGALLCLPTCWLATIVPYQPKSISLTFALMTLATASMLTLSVGVSGATSLARAVRDPAAFNASMLRALTSAAYDPAVRSAFSAMQIDLKCCGVQSSSDWYLYRSSLPPACCGRVWNGKRSDQCVSSFSTGCVWPALRDLKNYVNSVTVLSAAIIVVMAVTLFAASYSLVSEVVKQDRRAKSQPSPLCIACLPSTPPAGLSSRVPFHTTQV